MSNTGLRRAGDYWRAFAAGAEAWQDRPALQPELDGLVAWGESAALVVAAAWPATLMLATGRPIDTRTATLLAVLTCGVAGLVLLPRSAALRTRAREHPAVNLQARLVLGTGALVGWAGLSRDAALIGLWPLGIAAGCDVCRTARALGIDPHPPRWLRHLLLSPAHLGVVATLVVLAGLNGPEGWRRLAWLYAAGLVITITAAATVAAVAARYRSADDRWARQAEVIEASWHQEQAKWIHNVVLPALQQRRHERRNAWRDSSPPPGPEAQQAWAQAWDDGDQVLRTLQLDEMIRSGQVSLSAILGPVLAQARKMDIEITDSPSKDEARTDVGTMTGRLLQDALRVLVNNAVNAGTPTLAIRLRAGDRIIEVEVEDEAGGFDLDAAPIGRGLDSLRNSLRRQLGHDGLFCERTPNGSRVRATIPLQITEAVS